MPKIGPDLWKTALSFFWWREYADGRVEQEFDLETGQIRPWGSTPDNLVRAGWIPVTPDLAQKMRAFGEFGTPTQSPQMIISLKPGDELQIFKDIDIKRGYQVHCKSCGATFRSFGLPAGCPYCGAAKSWRCEKCNKILAAPSCSDCKAPTRMIDPLEHAPAEWEEVVYNLGIKGVFEMRFNAIGLLARH